MKSASFAKYPRSLVVLALLIGAIVVLLAGFFIAGALSTGSGSPEVPGVPPLIRRKSVAAAPSTSRAISRTISSGGIGPVRFGMTVNQAEDALGGQLAATGNGDPQVCAEMASALLPGAILAVQDGTVKAAEVDFSGSTNVFTAKGGIRYGSPLVAVRTVYPHLVAHPHPGWGEGLTLYENRTSPDSSLVFAVDDSGSIVTSMSAGESSLLQEQALCV